MLLYRQWCSTLISYNLYIDTSVLQSNNVIYSDKYIVLPTVSMVLNAGHLLTIKYFYFVVLVLSLKSKGSEYFFHYCCKVKLLKDLQFHLMWSRLSLTPLKNEQTNKLQQTTVVTHRVKGGFIVLLG